MLFRCLCITAPFTEQQIESLFRSNAVNALGYLRKEGVAYIVHQVSNGKTALSNHGPCNPVWHITSFSYDFLYPLISFLGISEILMINDAGYGSYGNRFRNLFNCHAFFHMYIPQNMLC